MPKNSNSSEKSNQLVVDDKKRNKNPKIKYLFNFKSIIFMFHVIIDLYKQI